MLEICMKVLSSHPVAGLIEDLNRKKQKSKISYRNVIGIQKVNTKNRRVKLM